MTAAALKSTDLPRVDAVLAVVVAALAGVGLLMVASASITMADRALGEPFHYLLRQCLYLGLGALAGVAAFLVPMEVWERTGFALLLAAFLLLVAVLIPDVGREVNGSTRWLPVGPFNLQASEPARLLIIMYLSGYVVRHREALSRGVKAFLRPLVFIGLACALLLAQPDFGAATVLLAAALGVLFVGGVRIVNFVLLFGLVGAIMGTVAVSSPYRLRRLTSFLDPWADPYDSGFQLTQSLIAIGRGEWLGVGLGGSVQKLFYLPEAHTDFVFAVYAEELGLVGVVLLVGLFSLLVWRLIRIAQRAAAAGRAYPACLTFGLAVWLGLQTFINIGVNMGLLPTKGLTLPLVSYGGSSLIICCVAVGLAMRVHYELAMDAPRKPRRRRAA